MMRWAGHGVQMGEMRKAYRILVVKAEGTRPLTRARHRWYWNNLREIGWEVVDWIHLAPQDKKQSWAPMNMIINFQVP
jgi:hypothetical protein